MELIKNFFYYLYVKINVLLIYFTVALYNVEVNILKSKSETSGDGDSRIQRHIHKNKLLEKFYKGLKDEKYVREYYDVLKKGDVFLKTVTEKKLQVALDKYGIVGKNEEDYNNHGYHLKGDNKTLDEIILIEREKRKTKDDDYKILYIIDNKPIETGISNLINIVDKDSLKLSDNNVSKHREFPIKPIRKNKTPLNKIEELTEFVHVKHIGLEHIILEFFIPLKFRTGDIIENSKIFLELININGIFVHLNYGESKWFSISKFYKRIIHNDYDVWKFKGKIIKKIGEI